MIGLAMFVAALLLIATAAKGLNDGPPPDDRSGAGWGALIFALCLAGILMAKRKQARDDDD